MSINQRLKDLGIQLPDAVAAVANYVPIHMSPDGTLHVSGQIAFVDGALADRGTLGNSISVEDAYQSARTCAINVLAQVSAALGGDMDRIVSCRKLTVFVAATPDFEEHPKVANGASDLIVEVLGEIGRHSRSAVGVSSLPFNAPVEVEAVFEVNPAS
ncbi:RidA family protein [Ruegeria sp. SCP11]|uniref:RidA family protein n=1 Tax=Ruegeria sp. SCP11 TaxID=3141378 RepID=UPI0033352758